MFSHVKAHSVRLALVVGLLHKVLLVLLVSPYLFIYLFSILEAIFTKKAIVK